MEEEKNMTATETARLIDWLIQNGHTHEEACRCIDYIAAYQDDNSTKKETPPPTK